MLRLLISERCPCESSVVISSKFRLLQEEKILTSCLFVQCLKGSKMMVVLKNVCYTITP